MTGPGVTIFRCGGCGRAEHLGSGMAADDARWGHGAGLLRCRACDETEGAVLVLALTRRPGWRVRP